MSAVQPADIPRMREQRRRRAQIRNRLAEHHRRMSRDLLFWGNVIIDTSELNRLVDAVPRPYRLPWGNPSWL